MSFNLKAIHHVEPAFAGIDESRGSEVHGVAFCMALESMEELDRTERGYDKKMVTLHAYDGRSLEGFIYVNKPGLANAGDLEPSSRYLGVLVKGAKQAGLNPDYIAKLARHPVYKASPAALKAREARPDPDTLKEITVEELAQRQDWIGVLGYIVQTSSHFGSHKCRDITSRALMQFHGIPLDDNDDKGRPPYPLVQDLSEDELEFITNWLDHYELGPNDGDEKKPIVGYLKEFKEQQKSGCTTFALPPIPQ